MDASTPAETPTEARTRIVLAFIRSFWETHGYGPTFREITAAGKFASTNGARYHLWRLKKRGSITWDQKRARSIRVASSVSH